MYSNLAVSEGSTAQACAQPICIVDLVLDLVTLKLEHDLTEE